MSVFSSSIGAVAYPAVSFSEGRRADRSQHGRLQPNRPLRATEGRQARRDRRDAHLEWIRRYIFPPNRAPLQADAFSSVFPVLSSQIEFDPKGSQARLFARDPPRAAVPNILIAKMRGGQVRGDRRGYPSDSDLRPQEIVAELHCNKGIGKEHAKWSPVGALSYRSFQRTGADLLEQRPRPIASSPPSQSRPPFPSTFIASSRLAFPLVSSTFPPIPSSSPTQGATRSAARFCDTPNSRTRSSSVVYATTSSVRRTVSSRRVQQVANPQHSHHRICWAVRPGEAST